MSESLTNKAILDAVGYERYKNGHVKKVMPILNKLSRQIAMTIANMKTNSPRDIAARIKRINELTDTAFRKIEVMCLKEYKELVQHSTQQEEDNLLLIGEESKIKKDEKVSAESVILASFILGKGFKKQLSNLKMATKGRVASQIRTGIADNESVTALTHRVRGTRGRSFKDGVFNLTLNHMDSIVRTSVQTFVNRSKQWVWDKMGIERYIWVSVLDGHTSAVCRGRSNKIYIVGSGPLPPAHYRCRSTVVAYRKGMKIPQSYGTWLKKQPKGVIEDILGKTKAAMFINGKLPLDKFTVASGRELTIKELRQRG